MPQSVPFDHNQFMMNPAAFGEGVRRQVVQIGLGMVIQQEGVELFATGLVKGDGIHIHMELIEATTRHLFLLSSRLPQSLAGDAQVHTQLCTKS